MTRTAERAAFEDKAARGDIDAYAAARALEAGDERAILDVAALCAHAAYAAPERIAPIFDALAAGWFGEPAPRAVQCPAPASIPDVLWDRFWDVGGEAGGGDAVQFTARVAAIGGACSQEYRTRLEAIVAACPGVAEAARAGLPERFTLEALRAAPAGSLGETLCRLIVDNGFDLEVLDRGGIDPATTPPHLAYVNVRILQCHDLWHLVAGYRTTALHEFGVSAFQLAQFAHAYSAGLFAVSLYRARAAAPVTHMIGEAIVRGWRHGRSTPPLIGVDWPALWQEPLDAVRARLGVSPFAAPYAPDALERFFASA